MKAHYMFSEKKSRSRLFIYYVGRILIINSLTAKSELTQSKSHILHNYFLATLTLDPVKSPKISQAENKGNQFFFEW